MCVVSVVGQVGADRIKQQPWFQPNRPIQQLITTGITREEFDALKRDVELLKVMLVAAKEADVEAGTPDCEHEEKVALLRQVAEAVGVSLDEVFGTATTVASLGAEIDLQTQIRKQMAVSSRSADAPSS